MVFKIERQTSTVNSNILEWNKIGFVEGHGNSNSPKYYSFSDNIVSQVDKHYYRLKQIDIDGTFEFSDIVEISFSNPIGYSLNQNYPNPFNPATTIKYSIPEQTHVKLIIYNLFGEEIAYMVNETKEAGTYLNNFEAENLASGIYFYSIETKKYVETRKFILLR